MRIDASFYKKDALTVAKELVGKIICRRMPDGEILRMGIIETECYLGENDTACHASHGKTERNSPLWLEGGYSYVYLCYGMYNMFNVITGEEGDPQGVLIRGVEGHYGPGRFTKYCAIDRSLNKINMKDSDILWIEDDGFVPETIASARVGIDYAENIDRERLWRFTDVRYFKK